VFASLAGRRGYIAFRGRPVRYCVGRVGTGRTPLLQVVVHEPAWLPELIALCAGFEGGAWRRDQFVDEIFGWLPSFVLPWSEQQRVLGSHAAIDLLRAAARRVYDSDKYKSRGEFGELILHGVLLQEYGTQAAISKFWFKDAANDTVKGFDVVHISESDGGLELWLGEAKFYGDPAGAVREAIKSVKEHLLADYLRAEFALVSSKIDPGAPYASRLAELLHHNTSLDAVFEALHLPILITYDSSAAGVHSQSDKDYVAAVREEITKAWNSLAKTLPTTEAVVHVILVPLPDKAALATALHERLEVWQRL
jgi:hypothetical protein